MKYLSSLFYLTLWSLFLLFSPIFFTHAATADLSISANHIRFSEETLYAGETVRLYATVKNMGDVDIAAKVIFYQGARLIGSSQTVSVLANGGSDDVYVDYVVPQGTFNIRAVIQGQDPEDENSANDEAITALFTSMSDDDHDTIPDENDNCIALENVDQEDEDHDGKGDVCDSDRDGDGVSNENDVYPDDGSKSKDVVGVVESVEEVSEEPVVVAEISPSVVVSSPSAASDTSSSNTALEPSSQDELLPEKAPQENPGIFGFGTLRISPYAQFSYRQIDWRTYEFRALPSEGQGEIAYSWDFGDGATSVQETLVHAFPDAGEYVVTLAVTDEVGTSVSDAETFSISFFHLRNPWIQGTLAALFFLFLGLLLLVFRIKEREEEKSV